MSTIYQIHAYIYVFAKSCSQLIPLEMTKTKANKIKCMLPQWGNLESSFNHFLFCSSQLCVTQYCPCAWASAFLPRFLHFELLAIFEAKTRVYILYFVARYHFLHIHELAREFIFHSCISSARCNDATNALWNYA